MVCLLFVFPCTVEFLTCTVLPLISCDVHNDQGRGRAKPEKKCHLILITIWELSNGVSSMGRTIQCLF